MTDTDQKDESTNYSETTDSMFEIIIVHWNVTLVIWREH